MYILPTHLWCTLPQDFERQILSSIGGLDYIMVASFSLTFEWLFISLQLGMKTGLIFHKCELWYIHHPLDFSLGSKFEIWMSWHIISSYKIASMLKEILPDCNRIRCIFCFICFLCYLCIIILLRRWELEGSCAHRSQGNQEC